QIGTNQDIIDLKLGEINLIRNNGMNGSFNMNNDIQDEIEFLFTNPEALILLCFLDNTLHERTPSRNIMDRGMECMKL
ncbi:MAG: hypothetical protein ACTSYB_17555, partial [Candidatus Helarchaeota archaeon]